MNNKELKIYIEASIDNLKKYKDNDKFAQGYIQALEQMLDKLKG